MEAGLSAKAGAPPPRTEELLHCIAFYSLIIHPSLSQHVMSIYTSQAGHLRTQNVVRYNMVPWALIQRLILPAAQEAGIDIPICPKYK